MIHLKGPSETVQSEITKGAPMKMVRAVVGAIAETAWALGVSAAAGLLLLS